MQSELGRSFRLAPMCRPIVFLTGFLLLLPFLFVAGAVIARQRALALPALLRVALDAWVWLRYRPTRFVIRPDVLEVVWPAKRLEIRRDGIVSARVLERPHLRLETGWCVRVGVGGLWGVFGRLWTERRGFVHVFASRSDRFVWIERAGAGPLLITPEQPDVFVRSLAS